MKMVLKMLVVVAMLVAVVGCSNNVKKTKALVLEAWPSATVGDAFDASFNDPLWEAGVTERNAEFVSFTGVARDNVPLNENSTMVIPTGSTVTVQFHLNKTGEIKIGYIEAPVTINPNVGGLLLEMINASNKSLNRVVDGKTPQSLDGDEAIALLDYAYGE